MASVKAVTVIICEWGLTGHDMYSELNIDVL